MTKEERKTLNDFQDAVGELVDGALRDGIDVQLIYTILNDESVALEDRKKELAATAA